VTDDPQHGKNQKSSGNYAARQDFARTSTSSGRGRQLDGEAKTRMTLTSQDEPFSDVAVSASIVSFTACSQRVPHNDRSSAVSLERTNATSCSSVIVTYAALLSHGPPLLNLVKGLRAFPAPISRDYRGDIEGTWRSLSCVVKQSPPLKGRPANDFSTVHVRQGDNAVFHTDRNCAGSGVGESA